jgi:hypothetical protein
VITGVQTIGYVASIRSEVQVETGTKSKRGNNNKQQQTKQQSNKATNTKNSQ